jgi:hypothetical protein
MIMLRDDPVIVIFDSPEHPPDWIEGIDIENEEYRFCDENGQRYVGEVIRPSGFFRQATFRLRPEGEPDMKNVFDLLAKAQLIEPNPHFADLNALKSHAAKTST